MTFASLQCTDELKVVSRENPKVSGVGNWGDFTIGVCHRKRRRHEHLFGPIPLPGSRQKKERRSGSWEYHFHTDICEKKIMNSPYDFMIRLKHKI